MKKKSKGKQQAGQPYQYIKAYPMQMCYSEYPKKPSAAAVP